jgi:hypothetical protein
MAEFGASLQMCVVGLAIYGNRAVNIPNTVELTVRTVEIDLQECTRISVEHPCIVLVGNVCRDGWTLDRWLHDRDTELPIHRAEEHNAEETLVFARLAFIGGHHPLANVRAGSLKGTHHHSALGIQNEDDNG